MRLLPHIHQVQRERGQDEISLRGLREAVSKWQQKHPERVRMAPDGNSRKETPENLLDEGATRKRQATEEIPFVEKKRSSSQSRQEAHRAALSEAGRQEARAANTASRRKHRDALPEASRQEGRDANTASRREHRDALPEASRQEGRDANAASHREHRDALPEASRQEARDANAASHRNRRADRVVEEEGRAERTLHDFETQAKQRIRDFISPLNMGRDTCACCNELNPPSKMHAVPPLGEWLACLQRKLKWEHTKHTVNEYTRNFYDVSDKIPALSGVPLAKEGIQERDGDYKVRSSLWT
jgi:hypothetical protein